MKVLVIGAGKLGAQVISQLKKNPHIKMIVADVRERPAAVEQGIIDKVDLRIHLTPLNIGDIIADVKPDLILLARTVDDWGQGDMPMGTEYVAGMEREISRTSVPVIPVSGRTFGHSC
ncbi:MAG: hypothetical protein OEV21_02490 [Thermoplasmata archaeon]|nr:hypothetical protein [Thermoplasmata archaeon]